MSSSSSSSSDGSIVTLRETAVAEGFLGEFGSTLVAFVVSDRRNEI